MLFFLPNTRAISYPENRRYVGIRVYRISIIICLGFSIILAGCGMRGAPISREPKSDHTYPGTYPPDPNPGTPDNPRFPKEPPKATPYDNSETTS